MEPVLSLNAQSWVMKGYSKTIKNSWNKKSECMNCQRNIISSSHFWIYRSFQIFWHIRSFHICLITQDHARSFVENPGFVCHKPRNSLLARSDPRSDAHTGNRTRKPGPFFFRIRHKQKAVFFWEFVWLVHLKIHSKNYAKKIINKKTSKNPWFFGCC